MSDTAPLLAVKDLSVAFGTTLAVEPDTLIVNITAGTTAEELEADLASAPGAENVTASATAVAAVAE